VDAAAAVAPGRERVPDPLPSPVYGILGMAVTGFAAPLRTSRYQLATLHAGEPCLEVLDCAVG
jgi:hypothetical protein